MNQKTMMIIAIAIVAAIVAAGCAVVLMKDSKDGDDEVIDAKLNVYGNADLDEKMDVSDVAIVQDIIAGNKSFEDYPFADANCDGNVDEKDISIINDLIAHKEGTTAYVYCLNVDGKMTSIPVSYPLRYVVPFGTNVIEPVNYAGGGQYVAAHVGKSSYPVAEKAMVSAAKALKDDLGVDTLLGDDEAKAGRTWSSDAWSDLFTLNSALKEKKSSSIGAVVLDYSARSQLDDSRLKDLSDASIPVISFASADAMEEIKAVLTLGFLFGESTEAQGINYAKLSWDTIKKVDDTLAGLKEEDRKNYICLTMFIYICQNDSTFNTSPSYAGGIPYYTVNNDFKDQYSGDGSVKMDSTEALSNYDDADYLINNRSMDFKAKDTETLKKAIVDCWNKPKTSPAYIDYFKNLENYQNLVYINNLLPGAVKIAYMAATMYGAEHDSINMEWANSVLQQYIDGNYDPLKGANLTSVLPIITYDMYVEQSSV